VPGGNDQSKDEKGGRVEGEDDPNASLCYQHSGDRWPHSPRQVDVDGPESGGGRELIPRDEIREQRLIGGHRESRSCPEHKGEREQEGRGHLAGDCQQGEHQPREEQTPLHDDEEPAPIDRIGQDAPDVGQQHIGQRISRLDQGDQQ
jgi:hypothetical protein